MNVIFVITNINGTYSDAYSFGLASLTSIAKNKGHAFDYALINDRDDYNHLIALIKETRPHIIAYTAVSSQFMYIKEISDKIREMFQNEIVQVCGGVHTTIFPESVLEAKGLDGIFIGESERAFSDFLDRVANDLSYKDVNNFAYNDNGHLVRNSLYPLITNLDDLPFPERTKYGYERFINRDGYAVFMFSRGCPYNCTYCSNHAIAKCYDMKANLPRYRSPDNCIEEIQQLISDYSIKSVYVGDDTFGLDKQWMKEFCDKYAEKIKLPLLCQLRVNIVNEELLISLKKAGCVHVNCGVESGNSYIRNKIMKRNISEKQITQAYALFKKYGMTSNAINIIGLPHETIDNVWDTIKLNRKINPTSSGVNIFYPYQGTELGDHCFEKGLVDEAAFHNFTKERRESVLNFSPEHKAELLHIYENWDFLVYKYQPFKMLRLYLSKKLKVKHPHIWEALKLVQRILVIIKNTGKKRLK